MATINNYQPESVSHPGVTLAEKLEELGMSNKELAVRTGKPQETISKVIHGKSAITPQMAQLFEEVMGIPSRFWLERDRVYQEYLARREKEKEYQGYVDWMKRFPYKTMAGFGWVPDSKDPLKKVKSLLEFFRVASPDSWAKLYLDRELKLQFRISLKSTHQPEALSAWLRHGELQADRIEAPAFSAKKLKSALPRLKKMMANSPDNFFTHIQHICLEAGVKVFFSPHLPKAPIQGPFRPFCYCLCKRTIFILWSLILDFYWFSYFFFMPFRLKKRTIVFCP